MAFYSALSQLPKPPAGPPKALPAPTPYPWAGSKPQQLLTIGGQHQGGVGAFTTAAGLHPGALDTFLGKLNTPYTVPAGMDPHTTSGPYEPPPPVEPDPYTDPGFTAAQGAANLGQSLNAASYQAALQRALIDFGDPALAGLAGFGLDPQAGAFAQQNYLSGNAVMSRLDKENQDKRRALINHLAGTGLLFSGETGYESGQQGQAYGQQVYDARKKLLDYIQTLNDQYIGQNQASRNALLAALQKSYTDRLNQGV